PVVQQPGPPAANQARTDLLGDPLPPGAVARIGTLRFRGWGPLAYSPDGKLLASGSPQEAIRIWEAATGRGLHRLTLPLQGNVIYSLTFSPDGKFLASGGNDKIVRLWDVATGKEHSRFTEPAPIKTVVFSPDGTELAVAAEKTIHIWDIGQRREVRRLT